MSHGHTRKLCRAAIFILPINLVCEYVIIYNHALRTVKKIMIAVVSKIYLMKHCDTLITLTENLGRGWEEDWGVQTSHFPCPVFPAPAPFLASCLKPLCKAAIIKMIVTLFSLISPASHPFLSLPLTLRATYSPGLPPPCAPLQD